MHRLIRTMASALAALTLALSSIALAPDSALAAQRFKDVPANHPFAADISWLADSGITTGYPDGTFHPSESVSRAAFAAFLYRLAGKPAYTAPAKSPFRDVPTSHQFYKEISWLAAVKITTGWPVSGGTEFRPEQKIARDAMAAFMYRYACQPTFTPPAASPFRDVPTNYQFYREISWMKATGLSNGWSDGTYRPHAETERAAIAAFLHRYSTKGLPSILECTGTIVAPKEPTVVDRDGTANDTYTIPTSTGVYYTVNGTRKAAGTYKVGGSGTRSITIMAIAEPGYRINGYNQWTFSFTDNGGSKPTTVAAKKPSYTGTADDAETDTVVINATTGVSYTVTGNKGSKTVSSGTVKVSDVATYKDGRENYRWATVTVEAKANAGYQLTGDYKWTQEFLGGRSTSVVTPQTPTKTDNSGEAEDTFTIPEQSGVIYHINGSGSTAVPGVHKVTGYSATGNTRRTATVTITAEPGDHTEFKAGSTTSWTLKFTGNMQVTPIQPTYKDGKAKADSYTIPNITGITYKVNGTVTAPGTYSVPSTAYKANGERLEAVMQFQAVAKDGYSLIPGVSSVWVNTFDGQNTAPIPTPTPSPTSSTSPSPSPSPSPTIKKVEFVKPTFTDKDGTANDTITIPSVTGLVYSIDGNKQSGQVKKGTYKVADYFTYTNGQATAKVTATAASGYQLTKDGKDVASATASAAFTNIQEVQAPAPTFADNTGEANDTFTIPSMTGVAYKVGSKVVNPGTYKVANHATYTNGKATLQVNATATSGYRLTGISTWSKTYSGLTDVTPTAPTFTTDGGAHIVIPNVTGVQYYVNGKATNSGNYYPIESDWVNNKAEYTVTVSAKAGYRLTSQPTWKGSFTRPGPSPSPSPSPTVSPSPSPSPTVSPSPSPSPTPTPKRVDYQAPQRTDENGKANDTLTLPKATGIVYTLKGDKKTATVKAGTYKVSDYSTYPNHAATLEVTEEAADGYTLYKDGKPVASATWRATWTGIEDVQAPKATFKDESGSANDTFTIPSASAGVIYTANGKTVTAGTYKVSKYASYTNHKATVEVKAIAADGYNIINSPHQWSSTFSDLKFATAVQPTISGSQLMIPDIEGVQYYTNGRAANAGAWKPIDSDYNAQGKAVISITVKAKTGYELTNPSAEWRVTFTR